jgi:hypothetical protein
MPVTLATRKVNRNIKKTRSSNIVAVEVLNDM